MARKIPLGIASRVLRKFAHHPALRDEALRDLGYRCRKCPRLLASGARCPTHRRLQPPGNHGILAVLATVLRRAAA